MPSGSIKRSRSRSLGSIATEKSRGNTTVTVPVHPEFAESLRAARRAGIIGAEVAAYADCTESQMAIFGWIDPKMPAHYIAQANREKLGISGNGEDRRLRSEPVARRFLIGARCEQHENTRREQSSNFAQ